MDYRSRVNPLGRTTDDLRHLVTQDPDQRGKRISPQESHKLWNRFIEDVGADKRSITGIDGLCNLLDKYGPDISKNIARRCEQAFLKTIASATKKDHLDITIMGSAK